MGFSATESPVRTINLTQSHKDERTKEVLVVVVGWLHDWNEYRDIESDSNNAIL
jgi:hypothetical protein